MRPAPGWQKSGDHVDGKWKHELLIYLAQLFNFKVFIETGTCYGETLCRVAPYVEKIYSVELSKKYFDLSVENTKHLPNVTVRHGESPEQLRWMLENAPNVPTLFWLDAHRSAPDSAGQVPGEDGYPLPKELRIITAARPDALIVIDDEQDATLGACDAMPGWTREYRSGEVILHRGSYVIPPFED